MLHIDRAVWEQMVDCCRERLPFEACGALFGRQIGAHLKIVRCVPIANKAQAPEAEFEFDPGEWVQALYEAERNGWKLLGLFHSHPSAPAYPSARDKAHTPYGPILYWIVSLSVVAAPDVRVYKLIGEPRHRQFVPIPYRLD